MHLYNRPLSILPHNLGPFVPSHLPHVCASLDHHLDSFLVSPEFAHIYLYMYVKDNYTVWAGVEKFI